MVRGCAWAALTALSAIAKHKKPVRFAVARTVAFTLLIPKPISHCDDFGAGHTIILVPCWLS
jgi:hypothetical protein